MPWSGSSFWVEQDKNDGVGVIVLLVELVVMVEELIVVEETVVELD